MNDNTFSPQGPARKRRLTPREVPCGSTIPFDDDPETTDTQGRTWPPVPDNAMPREVVLSRLKCITQKAPGRWEACCPSHSDSRPSLSITERPDGILLLKCFSGLRCDGESICAAIGLSLAHLFPTPYALRHSGYEPPAVGSMPVSPAINPSAPPNPEMKRLAREGRQHAERRHRVLELASELGVSADTLDVLRVGWSDAGVGRWVIPERDHRGRVVGVSYRRADGLRTSAAGGRRGLIVPQPLATDGTVYVCEGMSDTAAMLSAGRCAIGRPSAQVSALVRVWLARTVLDQFTGREVIVVGDRDDAGAVGAHDLADWLEIECGRSVQWALPQPDYKDVREQWNSVGNVELLVQGEQS